MGGAHTVVMNATPMKIFDTEKKGVVLATEQTYQRAMTEKCDAIRYPGIFKKGEAPYSNLAMINNPNNLSIRAIFPAPKVNEFNSPVLSSGVLKAMDRAGLALFGLALVDAGGKIIASDDPLVEATRQTATLGAAAVGGATAMQIALIPCAEVGALSAPIAYLTVPACLFAASTLGGMLAGEAVNQVWDAVTDLGDDQEVLLWDANRARARGSYGFTFFGASSAETTSTTKDETKEDSQEKKSFP